MNNIPQIELKALIIELREICALVKNTKEDKILEEYSPELQSAFKRLDELAALDASEEFVNELLRSGEFNSLVSVISNFRFLYNLRLEIEEAKNLISSGKPWEILRNFPFYQNYLQLARTEYVGAGLKSEDSILFLGSGPLPLSLLVLCNEYNLSGLGIEKDEERANLSRELIRKLGLFGKIQITTGDHFNLLSETGYDLYMIAAQAEPKGEIFNYLAKILPPGSKVSYRIYEKGLRRLLNCNSYFDLPAEFEEYLRMQPQPPVNNTVVFLKKK